MTETEKNSKTKHGHAPSQATPAAPRKVRFNVGMLLFFCEAIPY
jgi:hypothetical protein